MHLKSRNTNKVMQLIAMCCKCVASVLQCVASVLQCGVDGIPPRVHICILSDTTTEAMQLIIMCCKCGASVLPVCCKCVAVWCGTLQEIMFNWIPLQMQ